MGRAEMGKWEELPVSSRRRVAARRRRAPPAGDRIAQRRPRGPAAGPAGAVAAASAQFSSGTRNTVAPASRAARILNGMPPMGETSPVASIAPVPATNRPPVSSPGESLSTTASANISPADGPADVAQADPDVAGPRLDGRPHAEQALGAVRARGQRDVRRLLLPVAAVGHRHALARRGAGERLGRPMRASRPCVRRRRRARRRPAAPTRPGSPGTTAPTTTRVGMASCVIAASSALDSEVANCWVFSSRTCSSVLPGGKICAARHDLAGARRPGAQHLHEGQAGPTPPPSSC